MRIAKTGVLAGLALAAAAFALVALMGTINTTDAASLAGPVDLIAVDMDNTGNTAESVGAVDECVEATQGGQIIFDVIVNGIPPFSTQGGLAGYSFELKYDEDVVTIAAVNDALMIGAIAGSGPLPFSHATPDSDGAFTVGSADFSASYESGDGVLARITLDAVGPGSSELRITEEAGDAAILVINDAVQAEYDITAAANGRVVVDGSCTASATPTVTDTPTETVAPTPTGTETETPTPTPTASPTAAATTAAATTAAATTAAATTAAATTAAATATPVSLPPTGGTTSGSSLSAMLLLAAGAAGLAAIGAGAFAMSAVRRED